MTNNFKYIFSVFTAILIFFSGELFSQSPYAFNYQSILRNPDGSLKASQGVILKFEILDVQDQVKYTETHSAVSNEYGLVNAQIGGSTVDLSAGESAYFLKVYQHGFKSIIKRSLRVICINATWARRTSRTSRTSRT